jgi:signal transduction histidine kinase
MNLLSNGLEALWERPEQQVKQLTICTTVLPEGWIQVMIGDNGPGIAEQIQTKLFDPFFTTKPVGTGTGLGLSTSYQIVVDRHGGRLYCQSEPGKGTQFFIEIPS